MTTPDTYMAIDAIGELIAVLLPATDERRSAWEEADEAEQTGAAMQAAIDLDALIYNGVAFDIDQPFAWPRTYSCTYPVYIQPDDDDTGEELVAGIPRLVKRAYALQSAHRRRRRAGLDVTAEQEAAAHVGITSHSAGGKSVSMDLARANDPESRIDPEAMQYLRKFLRRSAEIV